MDVDGVPQAPFITISLPSDKPLQMQTNLPPEARPMVLWLLEQAKLIVLTQPSEQEKAKLVKPNGFVSGMLKRMGR